jgi:Ca2+-transporting ATPase
MEQLRSQMSAIPDDAPPPAKGLSALEAEARLREDGYNELPRAARRGIVRVFGDTIAEPMFGLLLAAGVIYLLLGDLAEALVLLGFAAISVSIAVVQESRSERVLDALRNLASPRALVIRDAKRQRIAGREVVRGDLVVLGEGDRVPADARLLSGQDLATDESLLTGEAMPVSKMAGGSTAATPRPGGDDLPYVFSGSLVVRGHGLAEVYATGGRSEIGKIGLTLGGIERQPTRLSLQLRRLVRVAAALGVTVSLLVALLYGLWRGSWLDGLLSGIALSMSMLPEEFPLVLTVFMVMGAWRISRARVLTRRAATIETLGAATVLCTDKTGTLTENRMTIAELRAAGSVWRRADASDRAMAAPLGALLDHGILASVPAPHDPMDLAFHTLGRELGARASREHGDWQLVREYGLAPGRLAVTQVWRRRGETAAIVAAKGAPETIAALCRIDAAGLAALRREADTMAAAGLRVLAVAGADTAGTSLPDVPSGFAFRFLGLVGLVDPLRPSAAEAVRQCRSAGIRVVMITGDYPLTAQAVARAAGLDVETVLTGEALEQLSDADLASRIPTTSVFARIMPEQKLRIVNAFKAKGEVVAMTGDGVNDAPSLKAADIGIAMGGRGSDVAREAAAIVLLDDDFASIVHTIRLGRRIYDNLQKAMGYILAVHVPIAGLALMPLLFGLPLILGPVHIAFLELVIDPACSIVFEAEAEETDVMRRPPRDPRSPLLPVALLQWGLIQGALDLLLLAAIFVIALARGLPENDARALTFASLVVTNITLIIVNRSHGGSLLTAFSRPNRQLWWLVGGVLALLATSVRWAPAETLFHFGALHLDDLAIVAAAAVVLLLLLEAIKPVWQKRYVSGRWLRA